MNRKTTGHDMKKDQKNRLLKRMNENFKYPEKGKNDDQINCNRMHNMSSLSQRLM